MVSPVFGSKTPNQMQCTIRKFRAAAFLTEDQVGEEKNENYQKVAKL